MENASPKLIVAKYSEYPGPRYCIQGEYSGEDFYHQTLNSYFADAYEKKVKLFVYLDGTAGYASSFLDEAFGNLVYDFSKKIVQTYIEIVSNQEPDWKSMILNDVFDDWENRRLTRKPPKKTAKHKSWYRLVDNTLKKEVWL